MMQLLIPIMICAAAPAAPPGRAATRPAADLLAMHVEAYQLLQQNQTRKAAPILDKVSRATPPDQRSRALVMNHAIVDVSQRSLVMRALKDLTEYLTKHPDPDEPATNLLGGVLNISVTQDPKLKQGALWQTAFNEWDRRNELLDHSKPGWRRWGTKWITDAEHAQIQSDMQALKQALIDQQKQSDQAYDRAKSLSQQYTNALNDRKMYTNLIQYLQTYNDGYSIAQGQARMQAAAPAGPLAQLHAQVQAWDEASARNSPLDPNFMSTPSGALFDEAMRATEEARKLSPELTIAVKDFTQEFQKLRELQAKVIRPQWPASFDPVDPTGREATKPLPTTLPATTAPTPKVDPRFKALPGGRKP